MNNMSAIRRDKIFIQKETHENIVSFIIRSLVNIYETKTIQGNGRSGQFKSALVSHWKLKSMFVYAFLLFY